MFRSRLALGRFSLKSYIMSDCLCWKAGPRETWEDNDACLLHFQIDLRVISHVRENREQKWNLGCDIDFRAIRDADRTFWHTYAQAPLF